MRKKVREPQVMVLGHRMLQYLWYQVHSGLIHMREMR